MNFFRIVIPVILFLGLSNLVNAGPKGVIDTLVIENQEFVLLGWACNTDGTEVSVKFIAAETFLGETIPDQPSETAVSNVCNSTSSTLRFKFSIPNSVLQRIINKPIIGYIETEKEHLELTGSNVWSIPTDYQSHPLAILKESTRLLFIGAHPDDEAIAAPILGEFCQRSDTECLFYVATPGGNANDKYCQNEEIRVRSTEMSYSAQFFTANLILDKFTNNPCEHSEESLTLDPQSCNRTCSKVNTPSATIDAWNKEATHLYGKESISQVIQETIQDFLPDVIITHHPLHGTSGHLEHKAISLASIDAIQRLNFPLNQTLILSSRLRIEPNEIGFWRDQSGEQNLWSYSTDAVPTNPLLNNRKQLTGWDFFLETLDRHPSQFTAYAKDRAHPLHYSYIGYDGTIRNDKLWVGNDSSGRLVTVQYLSDYCSHHTNKLAQECEQP